MPDLLMYFNLIAIPLYCFRRFRKKSYLILLNPCFYLLFFSYIYLTLSSALLDSYIVYLKTLNLDYIYNFFISFSQEAIEVTTLLGNWFTLVFFLFYIFSSDQRILPSQFRPKKITYYIALLLTALVSLILLVLIIIHAPSLLSISDRGALLTYYAQELNSKYKVSILIIILQACIAVIVWRKKNFKWYIFILSAIVLDLLTKGRTISFTCIVFLYINYVFITRKTRIWIICLFVIAITSSVFLRFESFEFNFKNNVLVILADAILSRFSSVVVYDKFLHGGDLGEYFLVSSLKFLPETISRLIFGYESYRDISLGGVLADYHKSTIGFGLASNIVGESLYYGGITFAILSPIIIGSIFYSMNQGKIYRTFPGFIFFCFLMSNVQSIIRSSFYDRFLTFVYIMLTYLIWISILEGGRVIFIKVKKNYFINQ